MFKNLERLHFSGNIQFEINRFGLFDNGIVRLTIGGIHATLSSNK